jgi:hypothetical protein
MGLLRKLTDGLPQGKLRRFGAGGVTSLQRMLPENRHGGRAIYWTFQNLQHVSNDNTIKFYNPQFCASSMSDMQNEATKLRGIENTTSCDAGEICRF